MNTSDIGRELRELLNDPFFTGDKDKEDPVREIEVVYKLNPSPQGQPNRKMRRDKKEMYQNE